MRKKYIFFKYYIKSKLQEKNASPDRIRRYLKNKSVVANGKVQTAEEINNCIKDMILSGNPFLAGRFGANELSAVKAFDFELKSKYEIVMEYLCRGAGFFPNREKEGIKFKNLMLDSIPEADAVLFWLNAAYSIFVGVFAHWVILLLYGKDYLAGTAALRIVVWYYGLSTMSTLNQVYLANDGKNRYINLFCIAGLITDVILNFILIPVMGINGAAIATLITHIVIQIVMPYMYKDTREIATSIIQGALLRDVFNKAEMAMIKNTVNKIVKRG